MNALRIPAAFVLLCLVKKLTVIGIIGNTQGVSKAKRPPKKPAINNPNKVLSAFFTGAATNSGVFSIGMAAGDVPGTEETPATVSVTVSGVGLVAAAVSVVMAPALMSARSSA